MGQPYVTGPVPIFLGLGADFSPAFLGYSEKCPQIKLRPRYSPVYVDVGGAEIPFDMVKQGSDAIVIVDMTYFDYTTYDLLEVATNHEGSSPGDLGTLMMTEMGTLNADGVIITGFPIWLPFFYSAKAAMTDQVNGYHFFCGMCMNDDLAQMGTLPQRKSLVFHCIRTFDRSVVNEFGQGGFNLFDNDMTAIQGLPAA